MRTIKLFSGDKIAFNVLVYIMQNISFGFYSNYDDNYNDDNDHHNNDDDNDDYCND